MKGVELTAQERRPRLLRVITWLVAAFAACGAILFGRAKTGPSQPPPDLRSTGLYADFASKTVDGRNLPYSPQYPLWSDGAVKRRWVRIPPGTAIDASDPDVWTFPAGARLWKEFSFGGRRIETRMIESLEGGELRFATYVWNADESAALLAPESGIKNAAEIRPGVKHDIPGVWDCRACHVGDKQEILGFSALQLSADRDPAAPHSEERSSGMVDLRFLIERKLIGPHPKAWDGTPPRIEAASPAARAALGYLHANCGNCHNLAGPLEARGLIFRHSEKPGAAGGSAVTASIGRPSHYPIPGAAPGTSFFIQPGDPDHSAVVYRMATRNPLRQMPPLGTKIVDDEAVSLITRWIREDLGLKTSAAPAIDINSHLQPKKEEP